MSSHEVHIMNTYTL